MAKQSIMPFASPHGGISWAEAYKIAGSTTYVTAESSWVEGEILVLASGAVGGATAVLPDSAGTGTAHNPVTHFIAATSSQGELSARNIDSGTATINAMARVYPVRGESLFITRNFFNASDTLVVPTITTVGDICGWYRDNTNTFGTNGRFGIDTALTGLVVVRVLDADYKDIGETGGTGVFVVFKANGE